MFVSVANMKQIQVSPIANMANAILFCACDEFAYLPDWQTRGNPIFRAVIEPFDSRLPGTNLINFCGAFSNTKLS